MQNHRKRKILVAVRPKGTDTLFNALEADFDLVFCSSMQDAIAFLDTGVDLIVCGMNFDDSSMFDLLQRVKSHGTNKAIPFLCIRVFESVLPTGTFDGVRQAVKLLGADAFIDLSAWRMEYGDEQANEKLRTTIRELLPE